MNILVVAGHGGSDPGAIGYVTESDITYKVGQMVVDRIRALGGQVEDLIPSIGGSAAAVKRAEIYGPNTVLACLHANAGGGRGFETFYGEPFYFGKTKELAETVHSRYRTLGMVDRGIKPDTATHVKRLTICRDTPGPAILLELGFVDNEEDAAKLADESFQQAAADVLAKALMSVAGQNPVIPELEYVSPEDGDYLIISQSSGLALDHNVGTNTICQWIAHGGKNQRWRVTSNLDGTFTIAANQSVLDLAAGNTDNGNKLIGWQYHGGGNQRWKIAKTGEIVSAIIDKAIDVPGGSKALGEDVVLWNLNGGSNQKWNLIRLQ